VHLGLVFGVALHLPVMVRLAGLIRRVGRVVAELRVLDEQPQHVDAKAVHPAIQPEAQHVVHRAAHLRIAPVQVRLFAQERVVVVLAGSCVPFPRRTAHAA